MLESILRLGCSTSVFAACCFCASEWRFCVYLPLISYYFLSCAFICLCLSDLFDLFAYLLTDKRLLIILQCISKLLMSVPTDSFVFREYSDASQRDAAHRSC